MLQPRICRGLVAQFHSLSISRSYISRTKTWNNIRLHKLTRTADYPHLLPATCSSHRLFSTSASLQSWLIPKFGEKYKSRKGRPRMATGGSVRGTTVVWGDYGLRMRDHDRRISAAQLKVGEDAIRKRLRGYKYRLYMRVAANIGVYTSGNDQRMGKGKGSFDHWATRVAVSRIIFELKGEVHEQVVRDAFRLAGNKLPGKIALLTIMMTTGS